MSEVDDLVKLDGVLVAGRFGPDGSIAEHQSHALFVEVPRMLEMARWFCAAATMMFKSMAFAVDTARGPGFDTTSWLPEKGWAYWGGDFAVVVYGDRFVFAEAEKIHSLDELFRLVQQGSS